MASPYDKTIDGDLENGTAWCGIVFVEYRYRDFRGPRKKCRRLPPPDVDHDKAERLDRGHQVDLQSQKSHTAESVRAADRKSFPRPLRSLVRFNLLGQNPVTLHVTGEGTPSRNSFTSFFRRRSTPSVSRSVIDWNLLHLFRLCFLVSRLLDLQPCPSGRENLYRATEMNFSDHKIIPSQVLPPAFHRTWCYRNSSMTLASEESEGGSFKSVPGWVKFVELVSTASP